LGGVRPPHPSRGSHCPDPREKQGFRAPHEAKGIKKSAQKKNQYQQRLAGKKKKKRIWTGKGRKKTRRRREEIILPESLPAFWPQLTEGPGKKERDLQGGKGFTEQGGWRPRKNDAGRRKKFPIQKVKEKKKQGLDSSGGPAGLRLSKEPRGKPSDEAREGGG